MRTESTFLIETMTEVEMQEFFDEFYEEMFTECEDKVIFVFVFARVLSRNSRVFFAIF